MPHRPEIATSIWMGGTHSLLGRPIGIDELARAVVIDCAGELPDEYRARAAAYVPRVIMDAEVRPFALPRLESLAREVADAILDEHAAGPLGRPERVYVMCQYGMNRSGLMTGLLLRALGEDGRDAVELIRRLRPGALSNQLFVSLIRDWQP